MPVPESVNEQQNPQPQNGGHQNENDQNHDEEPNAPIGGNGGGNDGGDNGERNTQARQDNAENADPLAQGNAEDQAEGGRNAVAGNPPKEGFFEKRRRKKQEKQERESRFAVLKRKLVDGKKERKEQKKAFEDEQRHSNTVRNFDRANKIGTYTNYAGIGVGLTSLATPIARYGAKGVSMAKEYGGKGAGYIADAAGKIGIGDGDTKDLKNTGGIASADSFYSKLGNKESWWNRGASAASSIGSGISAVGTGIQTGAHIYNARKSKSKYARKLSKRRAWSSGIGTVANVSKSWSSAYDAALMNKGAHAVTGGILDIVGGAASFGSNFLGYKANKEENEMHKKIAQDASGFGNDLSDDDMSRISGEAKYDGDLSQLEGEQADQYRAKLKARHTAKAKKYAMQQAAALHKKKGEKAVPGKLGLIGSAISGLGALSTGIGKFIGGENVARTIGSALGGIGGTLAGIGGIKDYFKGRKEDKAIDQDKRKMVRDYIAKKKPKIKEEARNIQYTDEESATVGGNEISDFEAEKIALMRLGVDEAEKAEELNDDIYDKAFDKLSEKRANNIFQSEGAEKTQMLNALGLDADASIEDIKNVIMGN